MFFYIKEWLRYGRCQYHGLTGVFSQLFFSLLVAFILSIYLLIKKVKKGKDSIAFAPAMLVGCVIATILTGL